MKTSWLKGLTGQQVTECKSEYVGAARLRERLSVLLEAKVEEKRKSVRASNTYESPSWALVQADAIGYEKALYEVISLISEKNV